MAFGHLEEIFIGRFDNAPIPEGLILDREGSLLAEISTVYISINALSKARQQSENTWVYTFILILILLSPYIYVRSIESSKLFYNRYICRLYILNSEMYFILFTKYTYTYNVSIYRYYMLNSKFAKWNQNSYV